MNITLTNTEFNEAIQLYLDSIGFNTESYDIETRVVVGRGGNETRAEISLERKTSNKPNKVSEPVKIEEDKPPFDVDGPKKTTIGSVFGKGE